MYTTNTTYIIHTLYTYTIYSTLQPKWFRYVGTCDNIEVHSTCINAEHNKAHALPNTKSALSLKAMPNLRAVEQAQQN